MRQREGIGEERHDKCSICHLLKRAKASSDCARVHTRTATISSISGSSSISISSRHHTPC